MASSKESGFSVDTHELKALSVPTSLLFMLGVEYDIFLCCTGKPIQLRFPSFAPNYRRLLGSCAERFGLSITHDEVKGSLLEGTPRIPVLRYADFLPGRLHVDEILAIFQVKPATKPTSKGDEFVASFIPYEEYASDASLEDVHGLGYFLCIEFGLSLATHGHLIRFVVRPGYSSTQATMKFQKFCGWHKFDLRFDDSTKRAGVVVMPSVHDAFDLFEKYEDEDSDDEDETMPFSLRPVAPQVAVPYMEDAQLRKLRGAHWDKVVEFWERFPKTKNTIVVSNLYEKAKIDDILKMFDGLTIADHSMVLDDSPAKRARAFVTFNTSDDCRTALALDGKNTHGKALRVQVSPPYIDASRRGKLVTRSTSPSPQPTPQAGASPELKSQKPPAGDEKKGRERGASKKGKEKEEKKKEEPKKQTKGDSKKDEKKSEAKEEPAKPTSTKPPATEMPKPVGVDDAPVTKHEDPAKAGMNLAAKSFTPSAAAKEFVPNVAAKEFVPRFSPELTNKASSSPPPYAPLPPPPGAPPPPPPPPPGPAPPNSQPPAYDVSPPQYPGTSPIFPAGMNGSFGGAPPAYALPPPGASPPQYGASNSPHNVVAAAPIPAMPPPEYMPPSNASHSPSTGSPTSPADTKK